MASNILTVEELANTLDIKKKDLTKEELLPIIKDLMTAKRKATEEAIAAAKKRRMNELYMIFVTNPILETGGFLDSLLTIFVTDSHNVDNVKGKVSHALKISPNKFILGFGDTLLDEGSRTLDYFNISQQKDTPVLSCTLCEVEGSSEQAMIEAKKERSVAQALDAKLHAANASGYTSVFAAAGAAMKQVQKMQWV
jgi:hypothetical protein